METILTNSDEDQSKPNPDYVPIPKDKYLIGVKRHEDGTEELIYSDDPRLGLRIIPVIYRRKAGFLYL